MNNPILNKPTDRNKNKVTLIKTQGTKAAPVSNKSQEKEGHSARHMQPLKVWAGPSFFFMY